MWAEDCFLRYVVHRDRNAEHGSQGDQIRSDMTMYEGSVVCSPVCYHTVLHRLRIPVATHIRKQLFSGLILDSSTSFLLK